MGHNRCPSLPRTSAAYPSRGRAEVLPQRGAEMATAYGFPVISRAFGVNQTSSLSLVYAHFCQPPAGHATENIPTRNTSTYITQAKSLRRSPVPFEFDGSVHIAIRVQLSIHVSEGDGESHPKTIVEKLSRDAQVTGGLSRSRAPRACGGGGGPCGQP